jgi:hypothetical protein
VQGLLADYEVIHWHLFPLVVLNNIWLKTDLLAGRVLHKGDFNFTHLIGTSCWIATEMYLMDPFLQKGGPPLDPESSRTLVVLYLTFSP